MEKIREEFRVAWLTGEFILNEKGEPSFEKIADWWLSQRDADKETTVKSDGKDEVYCEWFKCNNCKETMIISESNFCPNCGLKIKRKQNEK